MKHSILIFDSGVGGLSILSEIRQRFPRTHLHYLMDCAWFPYGIRDDDALQQRIVDLCRDSVDELQPVLLVLACNTASTLALEALRATLKIPVVGVVPAIKVAADQIPRTRIEDAAAAPEIGLLATPATVNRPYTERLIRDFAPHCTVNRLGSSDLVQLSEDWMSGRDIRPQLQAVLGGWLTGHPAMTQVVLGCTHFPLLRPLLEALWPQVQWIDSGQAVATQSSRVYPGDPSAGDGSASLWWTPPVTPVNAHSDTQPAASPLRATTAHDAQCHWQGAEAYLRRLGPVLSARALTHTGNRLIQ